MIVGGQKEARAQLSSTIIDYHEPFDQGLRLFALPSGLNGSPSQGYPFSVKFAGSQLYTWVKKSTARVKCLAQGMPTARARTRTARTGVVHTNHEVTRLECVASEKNGIHL